MIFSKSNKLIYTTVELESHNAKSFTKKGDYTKELTHAIKQIIDWRSWISDNIQLHFQSIQ